MPYFYTVKGRGILGALNKKSIRSLLEGIDEYEVSQKRIKGGNLNSIKSLYDEFLKQTASRSVID